MACNNLYRYNVCTYRFNIGTTQSTHSQNNVHIGTIQIHIVTTCVHIGTAYVHIASIQCIYVHFDTTQVHIATAYLHKYKEQEHYSRHTCYFFWFLLNSPYFARDSQCRWASRPIPVLFCTVFIHCNLFSLKCMKYLMETLFYFIRCLPLDVKQLTIIPSYLCAWC